MRAAALYSVAGALLLTTLSAAPAGSTGAAPGTAEQHGTTVAAARAEAAGITFGKCAKEQDLPGKMQCGTVSVPLDYARPEGKQIKLAVSRVRATHKDPHNSKRRVPGQGALVYNPGGPGASGLHFPLIGLLPAWKRLAAAYDLVGYAPRGVSPSAPLSCQDPEQAVKGRRRRRHTRRRRTRRSASPGRRRTRAAARSARAARSSTTTL